MLLYRLKSPEHLGKVGQFFGAAQRYKAISAGLMAFRPWLLRSWAYLVLDSLNKIAPHLFDFSVAQTWTSLESAQSEVKSGAGERVVEVGIERSESNLIKVPI